MLPYDDDRVNKVEVGCSPMMILLLLLLDGDCLAGDHRKLKQDMIRWI